MFFNIFSVDYWALYSVGLQGTLDVGIRNSTQSQSSLVLIIELYETMKCESTGLKLETKAIANDNQRLWV